jgi:hypothetical protein
MQIQHFATTPLIATPVSAGVGDTTAPTHRLELHNASVDEAVARTGACGLIHLPTGRTCMLHQRHNGSCDFASRDDVAGVRC